MKDASCLSSIYILVLLDEVGFSIFPIQGSRSYGSSVWVTDDGNPLPYYPLIRNEDRANFTALEFDATSIGPYFYAVDPSLRTYTYFVCEIEN